LLLSSTTNNNTIRRWSLIVSNNTRWLDINNSRVAGIMHCLGNNNTILFKLGAFHDAIYRSSAMCLLNNTIINKLRVSSLS
jgi:hypothetical protein